MLVLTRKSQEVIVVSGADGFSVLLKLTVIGIDKGKVRLGFEGADGVAIHRLEVWERIRAEADLQRRTEGESSVPTVV